jgi:hypothetical protein
VYYAGGCEPSAQELRAAHPSMRWLLTLLLSPRACRVSLSTQTAKGLYAESER